VPAPRDAAAADAAAASRCRLRCCRCRYADVTAPPPRCRDDTRRVPRRHAAAAADLVPAVRRPPRTMPLPPIDHAVTAQPEPRCAAPARALPPTPFDAPLQRRAAAAPRRRHAVMTRCFCAVSFRASQPRIRVLRCRHYAAAEMRKSLRCRQRAAAMISLRRVRAISCQPARDDKSCAY